MTQYVGEPRKLEVAYGTSAYITEPRRLEVAYPGPGISTGAVVWSEHSMDANTKILLHLNGEQGSTTFTDESSKAWTKVGNAMITTGQYKLGGASGQFVEATNDWIHTPDHADFYIGTGDYTIEFFVRFSPPAAIVWIPAIRLRPVGQ